MFHRDGGLTAADRAKIDAARAAINAKRRPGVGTTSPAIVSQDGGSALLSTPITVCLAVLGRPHPR